MIYFILDNNEKIELTHRKITFTETNSWFESEFKSEFSFPFEMRKEDFVKVSDFSNYLSAGSKTQFKGKLYRDGDLIDATLKIQQQKGNVISGIIFAGMEAFPNFDKDLKDLPLDKFNVADLKAHALITIRKDYPEVSHQFPMIHTDKYDPASDEFHGFGKFYNNYSEGEFRTNIVQSESNIDLIRNIMQPFPYLMHVVKAGIADAGYELAGDILEIEDFKKALIFRDGSYFKSTTTENIPFVLKINEWSRISYILAGREHVEFNKDLVIDRKGNYLIFGTIFNVMMRNVLSWRSDLQLQLKHVRNGVETMLFSRDRIHGGSGDGAIVQMWNFDIEIPISIEPGDIIRLWKIEVRRDVVPVRAPDYPEACSLEIIPLRYLNADGSPIVSVLDLNEVDLTRVVPDMKFGELISNLRAAKNLDLTISGNTVYMNFIQDQLNRNSAIDLSDFDIEEPLRTFHDERSYELSFSDGNKDSQYPYDSVFVQKDLVATSNYRINKNTTELKLDFLPYPTIVRNGISTSFAFDDEPSKLRLVFYNSSIDGPPVTFNNLNMTIAAIYQQCYANWINFLVNSIGYQWDFIISVEKFKSIVIQSLIYSYSNFHVFTEIEKERISRLSWRVSAKSESLI